MHNKKREFKAESFELGEKLHQTSKAKYKLGYTSGEAKVRLPIRLLLRYWLTVDGFDQLAQEVQKYLREEKSLREAHVYYQRGYIRVRGLVNRNRKIPNASMAVDSELAA